MVANVMVFGNQKGGVGKSTLSVLYALWLADTLKQSVCVIDLDTQANASKSLASFDAGLDASKLFEVDPAVEVAPPALHAMRRIALISATKQLGNIELAKPDVAIPAFTSSVTRLRQSYDSIVIDTPPALGLRMSAALIAATRVVCPIELEEYSIDGVTDMLKTIFGIRQRYNPRLELAGIVLNRFNPHSIRQKRAIAQLASTYPDFVIPARISTRSAIPEALEEGKAVWELSKTSARDASAEVNAAFAALHVRMAPLQRLERDGASA